MLFVFLVPGVPCVNRDACVRTLWRVQTLPWGAWHCCQESLQFCVLQNPMLASPTFWEQGLAWTSG